MTYSMLPFQNEEHSTLNSKEILNLVKRDKRSPRKGNNIQKCSKSVDIPTEIKSIDSAKPTQSQIIVTMEESKLQKLESNLKEIENKNLKTKGNPRSERIVKMQIHLQTISKFQKQDTQVWNMQPLY